MATELLQENYEFNAPPKVVQKMKYRDGPSETANIMWDKRVIRGNTYSSSINNKTEQVIKTTVVKRRVQQNTLEKQDDYGSLHQETQTDPNVEELTDKPPRHQKETQTEFIIEKIVQRLYMKQKTGIDVGTQIWDDGELFNFEYEVEPILQVLVQKTLDLSRMEVLQEEELREMEQQQEHYHKLKQAELQEQDRLEKKEQQLYNENIKLKQQYHHSKQRDIRIHEKLVSRVLSKQFLFKTQQNVNSFLTQAGFYRDPVEIQLISEYIPWIYESTLLDLLDDDNFVQQYQQLLQSIDESLISTHKVTVHTEQKRRQDILDERERQRLDKEEKERQRKERKRQRLERERRQKIKDQILEQLISKGEEKDPLLLISDFDGNQTNTPFIGYLGGFIGQVIIIINGLKQMGIKFEINELVQNLFISLPDLCVIEIALRESITQQLLEIDPEFNLAALPEDIPQNIQNIILQNITYSIANFGDLQFKEEAIKAINKFLFEYRSKIKFVRVKDIDYNKIPAVVRIVPLLEHLPFHPKSGKQRVQQKIPQDDDEHVEEEEEIQPVNLGEALVEQKATAFIQQTEEISTLAIHQVGELFLRQTALNAIGETELQQLIDLTDRCQIIENQLLEIVNLPVIDINQY